MMVDLLDIAPATAVESVHIAGGQRITVRGLHVNDIAAIVARFPRLIAVFAGAGDDVVTLFSSLGLAAAAIIAAGCDHLGDEKAEQIAESFLIEDQLRLFKAIWGLTLPNGLGPVTETIAGLVSGAAKQQQKVRVRLRKSPSASPPSSDADSRPIMQ
jgi:hypothetical protein